MKQYTDACNLAKKELDTIKSRLDQKEQDKRVTMRQDMMGYEDEDMDGQPADGRGSAQDIIDEEELALIQRMKEMKRIYRDNFDKLRSVKGQVHYIQQSIEALKLQLVSAFEDWYTLTFDEAGATEELISTSRLNKTQQQDAASLTSPAKKVNQMLSNASASKGGRIFNDFGDEEEQNRFVAAAEGVDGKDVDPDALAFIKAKTKVDDLQRAKKAEKRIAAH